LPEGVSVQNASPSPLLSPKPLMTASTYSSPLMLLYGLETNILSISAGSPRTCSRIKPEYDNDPQVLRSIERDLRSNTAMGLEYFEEEKNDIKTTLLQNQSLIW